MSQFTFKAKKPTGEVYAASRDAADRYELYHLIRETGDEVLSFEEKRLAGKGMHMDISPHLFRRKIKTVEKINFARNLGSMLAAGLALSRALSVLERQTRAPALKEILTDVIAEISRGISLADALARHPHAFPPLFVSMVHAGEQSGTLAEALRIVALQMESSHALERRIKGALIYPSVIIGVMVVIGILMMVFVVPTLMKTFTELEVGLPLATRIVLGASNLIQNHGLLVLLAIVIILIIFHYWHSSQRGKEIIQATVLKLPLIGSLVQEVNAARTARTLASLLSSGVDVVESVNITGRVVQNLHFRAILAQAEEAIKKGQPMSQVFGDNPKMYPLFFAEMVSVGEETGKIGEMLLGVAHYYEDDVEQRTKDMSTVIEPFLMIIIAAAVGFFALAMISPMYSLVNVI